LLDNSFIIFPGIGHKTERRLWSEGILGWDDFISNKSVAGISGPRKGLIDGLVKDAADARGSGDYKYFQPLLGSRDAWRVWPELRDEALCFDIETDGQPSPTGIPTVVGFYSHGEFRAYVDGVNLSREDVQREFSDAKLMVSFFGAGFDVPFLKAHYPGLRTDAVHFDLCPAGHRVGLRGGLKKVERELGIQRGDDVAGMDGYEAVLLWRAHKSGRAGALDRLVEYNREDAENLHALADIVYDKLKAESGFPGP
jgi:hypothetical protein